jgi:hypothetical protein
MFDWWNLVRFLVSLSQVIVQKYFYGRKLLSVGALRRNDLYNGPLGNSDRFLPRRARHEWSRQAKLGMRRHWS